MDSPIDVPGRKTLFAVLVVGLLVGGTGIAAALTMNDLGTEKISLFGANTASADITINSQDTVVYSEDRAVVTLTAENTDANSSHTANVTVRMLDGSGDVISAISKDTTIQSDSSAALTYDFNDEDVALDYQQTFIIVDQTS